MAISKSQSTALRQKLAIFQTQFIPTSRYLSKFQPPIPVDVPWVVVMDPYIGYKYPRHTLLLAPTLPSSNMLLDTGGNCRTRSRLLLLTSSSQSWSTAAKKPRRASLLLRHPPSFLTLRTDTVQPRPCAGKMQVTPRPFFSKVTFSPRYAFLPARKLIDWAGGEEELAISPFSPTPIKSSHTETRGWVATNILQTVRPPEPKNWGIFTDICPTLKPGWEVDPLIGGLSMSMFKNPINDANLIRLLPLTLSPLIFATFGTILTRTMRELFLMKSPRNWSSRLELTWPFVLRAVLPNLLSHCGGLN